MSNVSFNSSVVSKESYTWDDTSFYWDSPISLLNWNSYSFDFFSLSITDSIVSFSDSLSFSFRNRFVQPFSFLVSSSLRFRKFSFLTVSFRDICSFFVKSSFLSSLRVCSFSIYKFNAYFYPNVLFKEVFHSRSLFSFLSLVGLLFTDFKFFFISSFGYSNFFISSVCLSGSGFIISNLSFFSKELSLEDLVSASNRPFGYSNFHEFKVGEYEYQNAIVKLSLNSTNLNYSTAVDSLSLHVDIPDTDDRGVAVILAEVTYVRFNKTYYNPPEDVSISVKGGTTGSIIVPKLIDVDKTGFHVQLQDSSGVLVAGQISWASKGF